MVSSSAPPARVPLARRTRLLRWVRGPTFPRDVAAAVAVKFLLLAALKFAFFSRPQTGHPSLPPAEVAHALLSVSAPNPR